MDVDLLLVLAVDISTSIGLDMARVQREGYAAALTDPEVLLLVRSGDHGAIGVAYVEWSGRENRRLLVPWARIATPADATHWAEALLRQPVRSEGGTSIAGGIEFSQQVLSAAPWRSQRKTIDVSGDGINNGGLSLADTREQVIAAGITINGLAIDGGERIADTPRHLIRDYYERYVIGGPSAFVIPLEDFQGFGNAVRRKLVREIA
jgi:hypothetical protein